MKKGNFKATSMYSNRLVRWTSLFTLFFFGFIAFSATASMQSLWKNNADEKVSRESINSPQSTRPDILWMRGGIQTNAYGIKGIRFTPDGQKLIMTGTEGMVKVFRTSDGVLLRTFAKPDGQTLQIAGAANVSPDNQILAVSDIVNNVNVVYLYNLSDGTLLRTMTGFTSTGLYNHTPNLSFSPDGANLLVKRDIVGVSDGVILRTIPSSICPDTSDPCTSPIYVDRGLSFSPDGSRILVSTSNNHNVEINSGDFSFIRNLADSYQFYSPNGDYAYTSDGSGARVKRLSNLSDVITLSGNTNAPYGSTADFSPDGQFFAAAYATSDSGSSTVNVWQVSSSNTWSLVYQFQPETPSQLPESLAFSPDSQILATAKRNVSLWNSSNGDLVRRITPFQSTSVTVAMSSDGETIATANAGNPTNAIRLLNSSDGSLRAVDFPQSLSRSITNIGFADNNQKIITTNGGNYSIWNAVDGSLISDTFVTGSEITLIISPDGQYFVIGTTASAFYAKLYRVSDNALIREFIGPGGADVPLTFSPDGQILATRYGSPSTVRLWDVSNGTVIRDFSDNGANSTHGAFSPDGQFFAAGLWYGSQQTADVKLWRVSDGALVRTMSGHIGRLEKVAFAPDGQTIVSAGWDNTLRFWNAADGSLLQTYNQETRFESFNSGEIVFTPDGSRFAYGRADASVVVASNPFASATSTGTDVSVSTNGIDLTFSNVTASGVSSAVQVQPSAVPTLPANFQFGSFGAAYQIGSTASFSGDILIKFTAPQNIDETAFNSLRVLHYENGAWTDSTVLPPNTPAPDYATRAIYARVTSLSPFAVVQYTPPTYTISGKVLASDGSTPLSGVTVNLIGISSTVTDGGGNYSFTVEAGGNYSIRPNNTAQYSFGEVIFSNVQSNITQNIIGTLNPHSISGQITANNVGLAGVSVDLSGDWTASTTTDSQGNYSFSYLMNGGSYTVTPSLQNYGFTPGSASFSNIGGNQTANFTAASTCTYSLNPTSADVADSAGSGSFTVSTQTGCEWTAQSSESFLDTSSSGSGSGTVNYSYTANTGAARSATITVAGQTFTLNQAALPANCIAVSMPNDLNATVGSVISIPVTVSDLTGTSIESYDFTMEFDSNVLTPATSLVETAGTLSSGLSVIANSPQAGRVIVSAAGATPVTAGSGTLVFLRFNVIGPAQTNTALTWQAFQFNDGAPCTVNTAGQFTVAAGALNGTVTYGSTPGGQATKYVPGVTMTATGTPPVTGITNSAGVYRLGDLGTGNYSVTASKTGDINGISSLDASRIQQYLVGLTTLTSNQLIAADANNSNTVTSLDASRIQQYLVGIQSSHIIGQWKFVPANKQYNSVTQELTGEDYQAILVGEVSGNWTAPGSFFDALYPNRDIDTNLTSEKDLVTTLLDTPNAGLKLKTSDDETVNQDTLGTTIAVSLPTDAEGGNGVTVVIPVTVGNLAGQTIESFDFSVYYDSTILQPAAPSSSTTGTLSASCSVISNSPTAGRLIVSGACGSPPITSGQGTLVNLRFNVIGTAGQQTLLTFRNGVGANTFQFNDGDPQASISDGQFTVLGPTAASVSVGGRVLTGEGRGLARASVSFTDAEGNLRIAITNQFGYYRFDNVAVGQTYVFEAVAKGNLFAPQVVTVNEAITSLNFKALE